MLNMGEQVRILDLAEDLIRLSGLEPYRDIDIQTTGIRPGEKLREDLLEDGVDFERTQHSEIFRMSKEEHVDGTALAQTLDKLSDLALHSRTDDLIQTINHFLPSGSVQSPEVE
jgi:FlaA1/EpsC-like NDP-sugar epimerase